MLFPSSLSFLPFSFSLSLLFSPYLFLIPSLFSPLSLSLSLPLFLTTSFSSLSLSLSSFSEKRKDTVCIMAPQCAITFQVSKDSSGKGAAMVTTVAQSLALQSHLLEESVEEEEGKEEEEEKADLVIGEVQT